jgi:fucokinase
MAATTAGTASSDVATVVEGAGGDMRTIVVVTASNDRQAAAVEQELTARRQSGIYGDNVVFYAVPDPSSARVGSGGATFNALLTVQELVSSSSRWGLDACRIFMIHSGGDSQRLPCQSVCGKAWSALPTYNAEYELDAPIDLLLTTMFKLFKDVKAGLVVASSDVLLLIPPSLPLHWPAVGATGLAIPTDKHLGPNHGVYQVAPEPVGTGASAQHCHVVTKFWQKATVPEMAAGGAVRASDDTVLIDSGVVYFSPPATATLVALARTYPLDCCTYLGLDMSRRPLRIELYSDIMMAMGGGMGLTKADYHKVATSDAQLDRIAAARDILWSSLLAMPFYACVVEGGFFSHVGTTSEYLQLLTRPSPTQRRYGLRTSAAFFEDGKRVADMGACDDNAGLLVSSSPAAAATVTAPPPPPPAAAAAEEDGAGTFTVLNSLFHSNGRRGLGSVVEHSELSGDWDVGSGSLVSSVRSVPHLVVRDGIAVQELRVSGHKGRVLTVLGVVDPIKDPYTKASAVVCGAGWKDLFATAGVTAADIWPGIKEPAAMTIWTAKLWPVFPAPGATDAAAGTGVDSVTADRASLWLQWLAAPATTSSADPHAAVRRAHLTPKVLAAWRTAPRLALRDLLGDADASVEFAWRRALRGKIDVSLLVGSVAQGGSVPVSDLVRRLGRGAIPVSSISDGVGTAVSDVATGSRVRFGGSVDPASFATQALRGLDAIATTASADVAGRSLAVQAALLWAMAGWGSHGHRSGPAHNAAWLGAFALLDGGYSQGSDAPDAPLAVANRAAAVRRLADLRDSWIHRAHLIGRAARHYERAAQLLTAQCIYTAPVSAPAPIERPPTGKWSVATCPVRVDLAGGWSDTPPITFEAPAGAGAGAASASASVSAAGGDADASFLPRLAARASLGGGMVVNVGVRVDGAQPLGTRARRTSPSTPDSAAITIRTRASADVEERRQTAAEAIRSGEGGAPGRVVGSVVVRSLTDLSDFNQPHAEGALVKCALLCLGVVRLPRFDPEGNLLTPAPDLQAQLAVGVGGSLEVETWSLVPHGSGLGSSSILAATVLAALAGALGRSYDRDSLNHLVLKLEQMLSTGGGWQDQVGGLWPGVKVSVCPAALPVVVSVLPLPAGAAAAASSSAALAPASPSSSPTKGAAAAAADGSSSSSSSFLDAHMFLIYTGKTRLAKNLLQRVLRQWALRENHITETVAALRANAVAMASALHACDAPAVGAALDAYWEQKKRMAPMAEPEEVTSLIAALRPHIYGASLCGAGGGGFLVGIAREPRSHAALSRVLSSDPSTSGMQWSLHAASVDNDGLVLAVTD